MLRVAPVLPLFLALVASLNPKVAQGWTFEDPPDLDHRDLWGIRLEPGFTILGASGRGGPGDWSAGGAFEGGVSYGLPATGHEISARARVMAFDETLGWAALVGYRPYAGYDDWKTFVDLDLMAIFHSRTGIGARLGLGLMYDPSRWVGLSVGAGAFAAVGGGFLSGFDLSAGLQIRF